MSTDDLRRALAAAYSPDQLQLALPYFTRRAIDARATSRLDQAEVLTRLGDDLAAAHSIGIHQANEPPGPVTPEELRALADRARALAADVDALHARLRAAPDEPTQRVGFRLGDAAGDARHVGRELEATAADLTRVLGRSGCSVDWGVCPAHGDTLTSTGGRTGCRQSGCGREWDYDRQGLPCDEPPAYEVRDADGETRAMCAGHTMIVRRVLPGATITALPAPNASDGRP